MQISNDTSFMLQMIESGVKSSIPWSRKHFDFQTGLYQINNSLLRQNQIESRIKNIQYNNRLKSLEKQKLITNSLKNTEQRRDNHLQLKKRKLSLHCKKVNQKLSSYYTTQKNQYKKAAVSQKKFIDTISQHWKNKNKELQKRQRSIYKKYNTQKSQQKQRQRDRMRFQHGSTQFMTEVKDDGEDDYQRRKSQKDSLELINKSIDVRNRMRMLDKNQQTNNFQKLMRKLSKIQCKKKLRYPRFSNTEGSQSENSVHYISSSPAPKRLLGTKVIRQQPNHPHSISLVHERKKLPSKSRQNMETRKTLHERMYDQHTKYLENYKHRIKYLENMKQVKEKLIESKLYVKRRERRSNSNL